MGHEGLIACSVISRDVSQPSSLLLQIAGTSRRRVCRTCTCCGLSAEADVECQICASRNCHCPVLIVLSRDSRGFLFYSLPNRPDPSQLSETSNAAPPGRLPAPGLTLALSAIVLDLGDVFTSAGAVVFVASRVATQNAVATAVLDYNLGAH
ncbi:hypothetical protein NCS56_01088800 [Fusarium sp. Ph1]|nr:hypothetical protein NCS56_01088800 [Fusarium sp. Ph1]